MEATGQERSGDGPGARGALSLGDGARLVGGLVWFERRCFEALRSWSADPSDPEVAVALAEQAGQRAWHADLWFARLPELREVDADEQVAPLAPGLEAFCDALAAVGSDGDPTGAGAPEAPGLVTLARLAALGRVLLPHQVVATTALEERCRPAADRALARTARLVRRDQVEHWQVVQRLLSPRLARGAGGGDGDRSGTLAALAQRQVALEALLLGAGGVTGPTPTA